MIRDFFLGFIKLHIIYHATREPVYGLDLIRELSSHGYTLSPGTMYPILHNLEEMGYLRRADKVVNGKVRKYYRATPQGKKALKEARSKVTELVSEVFEEQAPDSRRKRSR